MEQAEKNKRWLDIIKKEHHPVRISTDENGRLYAHWQQQGYYLNIIFDDNDPDSPWVQYSIPLELLGIEEALDFFYHGDFNVEPPKENSSATES